MTLLVHNFLVIFSSFSPLFAVLIDRFSFLNCRRWFVFCELSFLSLSLLILIGIVDTLSYTWLYPLFIVGFNLVFTLRFGIKSFAKVFAVSLMAGFLLTETHEIANFVYNYFGLRNDPIWQSPAYPLHPLTNLYSLVVGYLLFGMVHFKKKIYTVILVCSIVLSSFGYYHFFYAPLYIPLIRTIQFFLFACTILSWGTLQKEVG